MQKKCSPFKEITVYIKLKHSNNSTRQYYYHFSGFLLLSLDILCLYDLGLPKKET